MDLGLGFSSIELTMDMNGLVFIAIEEQDDTKVLIDFWHNDSFL